MSQDETISKIISKQPKKKKRSPNILSPAPYPTVCTGLWTTGSYMTHSHFQKHSHLNRATYTAHYSQTLGLSHGKDPATIFLGRPEGSKDAHCCEAPWKYQSERKTHAREDRAHTPAADILTGHTSPLSCCHGYPENFILDPHVLD